MLNWGLCRECVVIPKATSFEHQLENMDIFDFTLTDEEIKEIEKLNTGTRLFNKFPFLDNGGCWDVFA
jgi:diketogulonate reductase-like aldo/keto reductase